MNREIKFRVWDKIKKTMLKSGICVGYGINGLYIIDADDRVDDSMTQNWIFEKEITDNRKEGEFVVMQYTGLKDKNDVEIYEGDILLGKFDISKIEGHIYLSLTKKEIETQSKIFIIDDIFYMYKIGGLPDGIEIIGNIYENPELLEHKKH